MRALNSISITKDFPRKNLVRKNIEMIRIDLLTNDRTKLSRILLSRIFSLHNDESENLLSSKPTKFLQEEDRMELDLSNHKFKIGFNDDMPYAQTLAGKSVGIEPKFIQTLAEHFNFTFELIDCDQIYGTQQPNGSWTGMIGMLARNEIDMGIGGTIITDQRLLVISYLFPHFHDHLAFATVWPQFGVSFDIVIRPFTWPVWLCTFAVFVLVYVFCQLERFFRIPKPTTTSRSKRHKHSKKNVYHESILWISVYVLALQSYPNFRSVSVSGKIFMAAWLLTMVILSNIYDSYLSSLITLPDSNAIDTVDKLATACQTKQIIPLGLTNSSVFDILPASTLNSFRIISQHMDPVQDYVEGVDVIKYQNSMQKHYAMIASYYTLRYFQLAFGMGSFYLPPEMMEGASFYPTLVSLPLRPGFEYVEPFNQMLFRIRGAGLLDHWLNQEFIQVRNTKHYDGIDADDDDDHEDEEIFNYNGIKIHTTRVRNFSLVQLGPIFYLFFLIQIISFTVFLVEILTFRNPFDQQPPEPTANDRLVINSWLEGDSKSKLKLYKN